MDQIREILSKIEPTPYYDWGERRLNKSAGYVRGSWNLDRSNREVMFVFKSDIEFAKKCLLRDYEEPTDEKAILKLCESRRTGNRRFPRFGWLWPQQGCILGRKELLKHPGKRSAWNSLYALVSASSLPAAKKNAILVKIDNMKGYDCTKKRVFDQKTPKVVRIRNHYQVCFSPKEMDAIMPILYEAAIPVHRIDIKEELAKNGPEQMLGDSEWANYSSTFKQKEIIDALSVIYKKFPVSELRNCELFADNRDFWEAYDKNKHGVKGLGLEELSMMVAYILSEMTKYKGWNGITFFAEKPTIKEVNGISYIADYGMTRDTKLHYIINYLPKLRPEQFTNEDGVSALTRDGFEYSDGFAAALLKTMFGNGKGYNVGGPIERLVHYADSMQHLAEKFLLARPKDKIFQKKIQPESIPTSFWPKIHVENFLSMLADIFYVPENAEWSKEYCIVVYALLVSLFPRYEDRYDFFEDKSSFYKNCKVANGDDANRKFKSRYIFFNEPTAKNRRAASYKNCAILDEALRNCDMYQWSAAIMKGLYDSYKKELLQLFTGEKIGLLELISSRKTTYSYLIEKKEEYSETHFGSAVDVFLGKYYGFKLSFFPEVFAAQLVPKHVAYIIKKISKKETRLARSSTGEIREIGAIQFDYSAPSALPTLTPTENILDLSELRK